MGYEGSSPVESGTAETSTAAIGTTNGTDGRRPRRMPNGSTSSTRPTARSSARSRSTRRRRSPRPWPACAPTRPTGRRSATRAATTGSASCATGCSTTPSRSPTRCRPRPARCAATSPSELIYLADLINFYGTKADKFIGDETVRAALAADGVEKAPSPVPPLPGGRRDQPLELPAGDRPRRLAPRPAGRRRGGGQAVRVHPARTDRDRSKPGRRRSALPMSSTACSAPARSARR